MGAGVSVVKEPQSTNIAGDMTSSSCENCSVRFSVLKRKKYCDECKNVYCAGCAQKVPTQSSIRRCERCNTLVKGNFNRDDLDDYQAKELKQFLTKRMVAVNNCTEKSDFVDLIMRYSNNPQYRAEQAEREQHLRTLQERMRMNMSPQTTVLHQPPSYSSLRNEEPPSNSETVPNTPSASIVNTANQEEVPSGPVSTEIGDERETLIDEFHDVHSGLSLDSGNTTHQPATEAIDEDPPVKNDVDEPQFKYMQLSQVKTLEAIPELTTRQLKEILSGNFVDYKGCVEKNELVQRVERLWKANQVNLNTAENIHEQGNPPGETDLCKICMDSVIDCVLLDCGHMFTCTKCGRLLAECPMCRQFVVRVVHVFKA